MNERVVFDCNVYFQALIGPQGPAANCFNAVIDGRLTLYLSETILEELADVCLRPELAKRFAITEERLADYLQVIRSVGVCVEQVPHVFTYARDPDDEHYVDLAVAMKAHLLVSRDKDLLDLNDPRLPEHHTLKQLHPELEILSPVEMMARLQPNG